MLHQIIDSFMDRRANRENPVSLRFHGFGEFCHFFWRSKVDFVRGDDLRWLQPGATRTSRSRGIVIGEDDMIAGLRARPVLTAILDVRVPGPPTADSPLYDLPNVVLTPHIAGALDRDSGLLAQCVIEEFDRWLSGAPLHWEIGRGDGAHGA